MGCIISDISYLTLVSLHKWHNSVNKCLHWTRHTEEIQWEAVYNNVSVHELDMNILHNIIDNALSRCLSPTAHASHTWLNIHIFNCKKLNLSFRISLLKSFKNRICHLHSITLRSFRTSVYYQNLH
jgi:hypothetical protein